MNKNSNFSNVISHTSYLSPSNLVAKFRYFKYEKGEVSNPSSSCIVELEFKHAYSGSTDSTFKDFSNLFHGSEDFSQSSNTFISSQDTGMLARIFDSINRSCRIRKITGNATDKAEKLSKQLSDSIDANALQALSVNSNLVGFNFFNTTGNLEIEKFKSVTGFPINSIVNDKIVSDLFHSSEISSSRIMVSHGLVANSLEERQNEAKRISPNIKSEEFTPIAKPVTFEEREFDPSFKKLVCYIIDRIEEKSNGERELISPLVILEPGNFTYKDETVTYGKRYSYSVRAVYVSEVPMMLYDRYDYVAGQVLISSSPSNMVSITVEEKTPPPPPEDLRFRYDHSKNELSISWSMPFNRQEDITRIQVFRRSSLLEPFMLLKEYDFDQSEIKIERNEEPLPVNISKSTTVVRRHIDYDFRKSSDFIYAVASVDAHGFVSNYSAQHQVTFNKQINALSVKCISDSGAPRPYPNIYVDLPGTLTLDSVTRSGIKKISITFDPEYLKVTNSDGSDLEFLKKNATYYMSIIDTTRAEQISIPISIIDLRSSE